MAAAETMNEQTAQQSPPPPKPSEPPKQTAPNFFEQVLSETERQARVSFALQLEQFKYKQRLADLFATSGMFAAIKNTSHEEAIAQAFVKIELGESMGFTAAESMQGIDIIQGRPAVSAAIRAAKMQRAGYHWEIDWFDNKDGICEGCRLWLYRNGKPLLKVKRAADGMPLVDSAGDPIMEHVWIAFMKRDAELLKTTMWDDSAGVKGVKKTVSVLEKDNWKGSPRNMYFARTITNAQRFHAPGVLSGDVPSTEEAIDFPVVEDEVPGVRTGTIQAQEDLARQKVEFLKKQAARAADEPKPLPVDEGKAPIKDTADFDARLAEERATKAAQTEGQPAAEMAQGDMTEEEMLESDRRAGEREKENGGTKPGFGGLGSKKK